MPAPRGLDQDDRLVEMVAHQGAEFQFDTGSSGRAEADGERAVAIEELDEYVVADDPLVALAQMSEKLLGFRVGGLMFEQGIGRLALHVRLPREDEHLDRFFASLNLINHE